MKTIAPTIKYIGQDDVDTPLFESQYKTPEGMCYNSFVIIDEKVAIMDTSDKRTMESWKVSLAEALEGRKPDYLVVHHLEPDHSSGISEVMAMYPDMTIICSAKAQTMIPLYFPNCSFASRIKAVKEGETLSLGTHELTFYMAPMVHWPEVMVTYDSKEKVLFSADAFGKFGVIDADPDDWACEARRYYFNICGKYGSPVSVLMKKISTLEVDQILPLHGPLLSGEGKDEAIRLYNIWSSYGVETEGVFIAHASIHGCTKYAAEKLATILRDKGCKKVAITDLCREDQAEAIEDAFRYGKVILAASSYDAGLFPPMYDFLHHLHIKNWQNREVAIIENGSWAPTAGRVMKQMLEEMKDITLKGTTVTLRGVMKEADIPALEALADDILK
ncbi:MAG: FprA family A-type flavoprotein [Bacteroidales bacterium]|nr:FprA family A-type flavoprotein [Bacteroidales bacterium]